MGIYDVVLFRRVGGKVVECVSRNFACLEPEHEIPLSARIVPLEFPFADSKTVVTAPAVVLLHEVVAASGSFSSDKCIENIETVQAGVVGQRGADHRCKTCSEIDGADHAVRDSRANGSRPPGDQWRPCPTFQDAVFPTSAGVSPP